MAEDRGQFTFWRSIYDAIEELPEENRLNLFEAICAYSLDGIEPENLNAIQKALFTAFRPTLTKGRRKALNGAKGGSKQKANGSKPKANRKQTESKNNFASETVQSKNNFASDDVQSNLCFASDTVGSEKEGEKEKEKEIEIEVEREAEVEKESKTEFEKILLAWNSIPDLASIERIDKATARGKAVSARLKDYGLDKVLEAIDLVKQSDFLLGKKESRDGRNWRCSFDWLMSPSNFQKVIENTYTDKKPEPQTGATGYVDDYMLEAARQAMQRSYDEFGGQI